jgi:hypothetical protein
MLQMLMLPTLVARVNSYAFPSRPDGKGQGQILDPDGQLVPLTLERERILGFPTGLGLESSDNYEHSNFNIKEYVRIPCILLPSVPSW